jgi:gas vesicle protein
MKEDSPQLRPYGFVIGMLAGIAVGVGLAMRLAPRSVSEIRKRVTDSARSLGRRVGQPHQNANNDVAEMAEDLRRKAQDIRDNIADAVAQRAQEVESYATSSKRRAR